MKFEIKRHKNGFVVSAEDDEEGLVCRTDCENEHDAFVTLLHEFLEIYGPSDSRYSDRRIHIHVTKGDKCDGPRGSSEYMSCQECGAPNEMPTETE